MWLRNGDGHFRTVKKGMNILGLKSGTIVRYRWVQSKPVEGSTDYTFKKKAGYSRDRTNRTPNVGLGERVHG